MALGDAVIGRNRQPQHWSSSKAVLNRHGTLLDGSHGENCSLRRGEDGAERVGVVHAGIDDGAGSPGKIARAWPAPRIFKEVIIPWLVKDLTGDRVQPKP